MASIAKLLYTGASGQDCLSETPPLLKVTEEYVALDPIDRFINRSEIPTGLRCQAFLSEGKIIIGIRGTELTADSMTMVYNLVADMGIGRLKSNEDIIESLTKVDTRIKDRFGEEKSFGPRTLSAVKLTLENRMEGHSTYERTWSAFSKMATTFMSSAPTAAKIGLGVGGVLLAGATAMGAPIITAAAAAAQVGTLGTAAISLVASAASGLGVTATAADGYETLKSYVKAIDAYVAGIKSLDVAAGKQIIFSGHSLGGFLAAITGLVHNGATIFSFNGPGVKETDLKIYEHLGAPKTRGENVKYLSFLAGCDAIGNLGARDGQEHILNVPLPFKAPLDHHGIDVLRAVLHEAKVQFKPFPKPALLDELEDMKKFI
jgi:hypothetical protein